MPALTRMAPSFSRARSCTVPSPTSAQTLSSSTHSTHRQGTVPLVRRHTNESPTSGPKTSQAHPGSLCMSLGAGPRHLALHPSGKLVFVVNELNDTVICPRAATPTLRPSCPALATIAQGQDCSFQRLAIAQGQDCSFQTPCHCTGSRLLISTPCYFACVHADERADWAALSIRLSCRGDYQGTRHLCRRGRQLPGCNDPLQ